MPYCFTGLCRCCRDPTFQTFDDAVEIQQQLEDGTVHLAKEVDVIALGLIHERASTLIPVCLSPTCKKDAFIGESTDTYKYLISAVHEDYHHFGLDQLLGPYCSSACNGDSAFCKAAGLVFSDMLPHFIVRLIQNCSFFNK